MSDTKYRICFEGHGEHNRDYIPVTVDSRTAGEVVNAVRAGEGFSIYVGDSRWVYGPGVISCCTVRVDGQ